MDLGAALGSGPKRLEGAGDLDGWRFWLEHVTDGVRVIMSVREGERADWIVPAR